MSLVTASMKRPVTVTMLTMAALIFGFVSLGRLPLNLLPDISYPTLTISTEYADAAPAEVEKLVTEPLEEAVAVVRGLRSLRSTSRAGVSEITLEFGWKTKMDYAALDVREKIDLVRLPDDAEAPVLLRYDPSLDPIIRLGLYGDKDPVTMRHLAERLLKKDLESLEGVASVRVQGGLEEEIHVEVDEGKLAALDIPISTVSNFLDAQNVNAAGGRLRDRDSEYLVRTMNEFSDLDDLRATVLYEEDGRTVTLRDVATIQRGYKERDVIARVQGAEAVEMALFKEGDANTVQVARSVKNRLQQLDQTLPEGVSTRVLFDQSVFIEQSLSEVKSSAMIGGVLAVIVLFLFLRHRKSTGIVAGVIPVSILATFFVMQQFGVSLNIMSLGGLALGVGMLVDNAIVVLESIDRHRGLGKGVWAATRDGAGEVSRAVIASTLTTVAVFLPIVFVEGIAGQIFRDQALTVTASLLVSLIAALTLIPMLSSMGHRPAEDTADEDSMATATPDAQGTAGLTLATTAAPEMEDTRIDRPRRFARLRRVFAPVGRLLRVVGRVVAWPVRWVGRLVFFLLPGSVFWILRHAGRALALVTDKILAWIGRPLDAIGHRISNAYLAILSLALRQRGATLLLALAVGAGGFLLAPRLGTELVPQFSQGEFSFDLELPPGTPLHTTEKTVRGIERELAEIDGVDVFFTTVGESPSLTASATQKQENLGQINVVVSDGGDPLLEEKVIDEVRTVLAEHSDIRHTFRRPSYFSFKTPIEIHVFGYDLDELRLYSQQLAQDIGEVPGLRDVRSNMEDGSPEVQIEFQRDRMAALDLDLESVARTLRNKIRGDVATRLKERDRQLDILVRTAQAATIDVTQVEGMVVSQVEGIPIPLSSVARVALARGPAEITRVDQHRAAIVSGNLAGRDLGSATKEIRRVLRDSPPPDALAASFSGQNEEVATSFRSLLLAVCLAIFMVYMVMASQFESFLHPFVILLTVPLGMVGVILSLALTSTPISVVVLIGAVMLTGIVVNNAIVLIDFINQRRREGMAKLEAIIDGARARIRPIMMTTLTTVLGLLPLAIGVGEGAEIRTPMAIAVIGGLIFGTALTLVVIPVVYATLDRKA